ncbi:hypothetical protein M0813_16503 [Anaeramoeba flamelloides]|uniref:t-SNARE coiled-coil homology domain-containing protein n=1 Tax=Anaeramoeba flamelloides TaxID=1746091 RepID=A0ABQ8YZH0_9EUKA|nr:hypothetical protein M0813_16503 [Anaeramoeba flamelloides]
MSFNDLSNDLLDSDNSDLSDPFEEIFETAKSELSKLGRKVQRLRNLVLEIGLQADDQEHRKSLKLILDECDDGVIKSREDLESIREYVDESNKMRYEKLLNDSSKIYEEYRKLTQTMKEKISQLPQPGSDNDENTPLMDNNQKKQQSQISSNVIDWYADLIEERENSILELEQSILEVNQMFKDMAFLVHGQGKKIETIHENVEDTLHKTKQGNEQLRKASKYQKSSRKTSCWLLCLIALILLVVVLLLLVILKMTNVTSFFNF